MSEKNDLDRRPREDRPRKLMIARESLRKLGTATLGRIAGGALYYGGGGGATTPVCAVTISIIDFTVDATLSVAISYELCPTPPPPLSNWCTMAGQCLSVYCAPPIVIH
jgi:hypothetical protein